MSRRPWGGVVVLAAGLATLAMAADSAGGQSKASWEGLRVDTGRIERRIQELSRFGENPEGGVSRVAFGEADIAGREYIESLMREAGLEVRID